jgi:2-polyprenyl-6-methoxyphenol hydroxylase-like FAD-dependent oxidoreductase
VDTSLTVDEGNFLFLDASTSKPRYRIPPSKRRLRLHRQKLRDLLSSGLDIQEGKGLVSVETLPSGGVVAHFSDGTSATGSILIGADGNNSRVRKGLMGAEANLNLLPVNLVGVIRHFTPEQAAPARALDPLLFQALHPETSNYLWYSIQVNINYPISRYQLIKVGRNA